TSPCQSGFSSSLFVSAMTTDRSLFLRIAAPNSLFPRATPSRVFGTMSFSITANRRLMRCASAMSGQVDFIGFGEVEFLEIAAIAHAIDDEEILRLVERCQHAMPAATRVVHALAALGQEGAGHSRSARTVRRDDH